MIDVSETLNQLGGLNKLRAMIGARDFIQSREESYLQFTHTKGSNKGVKVRIFLIGDLYTVVWYQRKRVEVIPGSGLKVTDFVECDSIEMVCGDQLKEVFESRTGLYLSL